MARAIPRLTLAVAGFTGELEIGDDCRLLSWNNFAHFGDKIQDDTLRFSMLPLDLAWAFVRPQEMRMFSPDVREQLVDEGMLKRLEHVDPWSLHLNSVDESCWLCRRVRWNTVAAHQDGTDARRPETSLLRSQLQQVRQRVLDVRTAEPEGAEQRDTELSGASAAIEAKPTPGELYG